MNIPEMAIAHFASLGSGVMDRTSASQSVDQGSILLSSHIKDLKNGIYKFSAQSSAIGAGTYFQRKTGDILSTFRHFELILHGWYAYDISLFPTKFLSKLRP